MQIVRLLSQLPAVIAYALTDQRAVIDADLDRWMTIGRQEDWYWAGRHEQRFGQRRPAALLAVFWHARAFRDLFYARLSNGNRQGRLSVLLLRPIYRGEPALNIACRDIGPGLYIAHGFASYLAAKRIGANCRVHHNVTLGWDSEGRAPVLEDEVTVYTGAVVFGDITIGQGATIGANAVVRCDVPPGATAVGVPYGADPAIPKLLT